MSLPGDKSNLSKGSSISPSLGVRHVVAEIPAVEVTGPRSSSADKSPLSAYPGGLATYGTSPSLLHAPRPLLPGSEESEQRGRLKERFVSPAASVRSRGSSGSSDCSAHSSRRGSDASSDTLCPQVQAPGDPNILDSGSSSKLHSSSLRTPYHSQPGSGPASPVRRGRGLCPRDQSYRQHPPRTGPSLQLGHAQDRRESFSGRAPEHRSFSQDNLAQKGEQDTPMHLADTAIKHLRKPGSVGRGTMALYSSSHLDAKLFEAGQYQLSRDQRTRLTTMIGAVRNEAAPLGSADTTPLSPEDTEHAVNVWRDFRRSMTNFPVLSDETFSGDQPAQNAPRRALSTARLKSSPRAREPQMIPMQATDIKRREERNYKDHYMENCWEASWLSDLATRPPSPPR